ncbi:uncharacterized protein LOC118200884 [Stegodyphus dumicola]|uniref:uncharacterized protein LOC118200884 n=1 Tax=Stegodyphus dumicola TaxID=202533 RepID=UPI0015B02764|nr:uncharacterized protein LOC118200884 [Stegodyphus dumicola]
MRDKDNHEEEQNFNALKDSACKVKALEEEIQRLRSQISRMTGEVLNSASVVKVLFKNEMILKKYKSKVELFLKDLLVEGEEFVIHCEMQDNTEQEFEELHQAFHIDKFKSESCAESSLSGNIPFYSKSFEDVLHDDEQQATEKFDKGNCDIQTS